MNVYRNTVQLLGAGLRPGAFFAGWSEESRPATWSAIVSLGLFLCAIALLLFLSGLVFDNPLGGSLEALALRAGTTADLFSQPAPVARFFFPLYWLGYLAVVASIRHVTLVVFGSPVRMATTLLICAVGVVPLALVSGIQGLFNNLLPLWLVAEPNEYFAPGVLVRMGLSFVFFTLSVAGEGNVIIRGFRARADQNTGRAVLAWLSPALVALILAAFYIVVF